MLFLRSVLLFWMRCIGPTPFQEKHPQTMMFPPPYFTVFLVYFGFNSMFLGRRTYSFPSVPHKFILVSSVQRIFRHFSGGQCRCFFANIILFRIFFLLTLELFWKLFHTNYFPSDVFA